MVEQQTRDWKVSTTYRVLRDIAWATFALAAYGAVAAIVIGETGAWWMAAGLAAVTLALVSALPDPVPHDMYIGNPRRVHWRDG